MPKVLFVCTHNSARSQMAEAYLKKFGGDRFEVESAGLEAGILNSYVVRALREEGMDISGKNTQDVFDLLRKGRFYNFVIAVCSKEAADRCPIFPGRAARLVWSYPDPATFVGSDDEIMAQVRDVRNAIRDRVRQFSEEALSLSPSGGIAFARGHLQSLGFFGPPVLKPGIDNAGRSEKVLAILDPQRVPVPAEKAEKESPAIERPRPARARGPACSELELMASA